MLRVTGSLLPKTKTICNAPPNREVNRSSRKKYRFSLNTNKVDRSLFSKGMFTNGVEFLLQC